MNKHILTTSQDYKTIILTTRGTIPIRGTSLTKTIIRTGIFIVIIIKVKIVPGAAIIKALTNTKITIIIRTSWIKPKEMKPRTL